MTTPPPAAAPPPASTTAPQAGGTWWVLAPAVVSHGQPPFQVVQSVTRPKDTAAAHVVAGPFTSKQAAESWINSQTGGGFSFPAPPNPLAFLGWLQEAGHFAGLLISAVTDVHLYISLGWLMLGFGLVMLGVVLWVLSTKAAQHLETGVSAAGALAL